MVKTCIFDIDNTLYDYDAAHAVAFPAVQRYAEEHLGLGPEAFTEAHRAANRELVKWTGGNCAAIHNRLIRYQQLLEAQGKPLFHAMRMAELYWSTFIAAIRPFPDAASCLEQLRAAGCRIGIGTNMTADYQFAKLEKLGLLPLIDFLVSSEEANAEKPDPRLFARCVLKAGCTPSECAFVGDNLEGDAQAATRAGLKGIWLSPEGAEPEGALRIRSLSELPGLIPNL